MSIELPEKFESIVVNASDDWLNTRGMTRDELRKFIEKRVIRDNELSPKIGDDAPELDLERLNSNGTRSGETGAHNRDIRLRRQRGFRQLAARRRLPPEGIEIEVFTHSRAPVRENSA